MGEPNRAPAAGAIVMVRVAVLLLLRLAGVVLIVGACLSLIPVLEGLNKSLPVDNPLLAFRYNAGKDFITLVVRVATGLALCLLSARMTAWMVPGARLRVPPLRSPSRSRQRGRVPGVRRRLKCSGAGGNDGAAWHCGAIDIGAAREARYADARSVGRRRHATQVLRVRDSEPAAAVGAGGCGTGDR